MTMIPRFYTLLNGTSEKTSLYRKREIQTIKSIYKSIYITLVMRQSDDRDWNVTFYISIENNTANSLYCFVEK